MDMENVEGERDIFDILHLGEGKRGMDMVTELDRLAGKDSPILCG